LDAYSARKEIADGSVEKTVGKEPRMEALNPWSQQANSFSIHGKEIS